MGGETLVSGRMKNHRPRVVSILMLISVLLALGSIAVAQDAPGRGEERRPYKLPPNLLGYLKDKYVEVDDFLISTLQETPDGPLGHINIRGKIAPAAEIKGANREERVRATAMAFIREEAVLLDIANPAELREISFKINERSEAAVAYVRYIGDLQLVGTMVDIRVGREGEITRVYATLKPASRELYEAVGRRTLAKDEVIKIVERDLAPPDRGNLVRMISEPGTFATWRAPYVVWGAAASFGDKPAWGYTIDAFTGEILNKICTANPIRYDPNSTPCD